MRSKLTGGEAVPWLALGIAVLHLCLSVLYSVVIPPWEGVDEWGHYRVAEYIARHKSLPSSQQSLNEELGSDQITQPPLYYFLSAIAIFPVLPSEEYHPETNPYVLFGQHGNEIGGVNFAVHDPAGERFPWRGTILALHLARLVSVILGTWALWPTYALGRFLFPRVPALALGAMAFQAFLPQYVYLGSIVNNDILVALVGGLVLYEAVRVAWGPLRPRDVIGLVIGSAFLFWTKANGMALMPVAGLALLIGLGRPLLKPAQRRPLLSILLAIVATLALLAGLWALRKIIPTGSIFSRFTDYPVIILYWIFRRPDLVSALHFEALAPAWPNLPVTFWGLFGWENIPTFSWFYTLSNILAWVALVGIILHFVSPRGESARGGLSLLVLAGGGVLLLAVYRVIVFYGGLPGRYLYPALAGISVLFALGLIRHFPARAGTVALGVVGAFFALVSITTLFVHIAPAYTLSRSLSPAEIPATAQTLHTRFGDVAELVAYELHTTDVRPDESVRVTLYWRVLARTPRNYTLGVHILGPLQEDYGALNTYPGQGEYATTRWEPGTLFRETASIVAKPTGPLPSLGRVSVALFLADASMEHLPVVDQNGNSLGRNATFGRLRLSRTRVSPPPTLTRPVLYSFGPQGNIQLRSAESSPRDTATVSATLTVTLTWQYVGILPDGLDLHTFVHVVDKENRIVRQADAAPGGYLLPTGLWRSGDWVTSVHRLPLDGLLSSEYRLAVGLYVPESEEKLVVRNAKGEKQRDNSVILLRWSQ